MMRRLTLIAALALLGGAATLRAQQAPTAAPAETEPYLRYGCAQCHGTVGQGALSAPPLPRGYPLEALLAKLRGKAGAGRMEIYTERALPDHDVERIAAYLAALPEDPPVEKLPLLSH